MPDRTLSWHYRSRHPSLIEVSNYQFYKGRLFLPPSPLFESGDSGFRVSYVPGAYDRGNTRTNRIEAEAVVAAIAAHARQRKDQSLGVVTFSTAQRNLIQSLLEAERRRMPELEMLLQGGGREPFFVKNLENVQGDERDVIMVSVGYGPRAPGEALDSMLFGPVSVDGGERRLNVLFTRAKRRCEVFCSFHADDIDLSRAAKEGARVLKQFLKFGETGRLDLPAVTGLGYDSAFEEAVAREIRRMGYEVDTQVGSAGFRIDLAVRDPRRAGRYLLAVECDGAAYHSAFWARERDRLRDEILGEFGWVVHRIWSTDWFRRGDDEVARLRARIEQALATGSDVSEAPAAADVQPATEPTEAAIAESEPMPVSAADSSAPVVITIVAATVEFEPYREVALKVATELAPHDVPVGEMAKIVRQIVEGEGPVHQDEVGRRVAAAFDRDRAGPRIAAAVLRALAAIGSDVAESDGFWDVAGRDVRIRSRAGASASLRRADMLPAVEVAGAIARLVRDNGSFAKSELVIAVARALGFDRAGADLKARLGGIVDALVAQGALKFDGVRYASA
jgi:very-short-patch-repair endonuclease